ncbi:MAG: response regulator [Desulfobacteraceae bacterium]|nr:response regulator [Desulfobacteraceae bacterium]
MIHCLYGFTFSYLVIESKLYHTIASICHGLILIFLWSTNIIVSESFTTRNFIGLESPYIEPALGPLGFVFVLYAAISGVIAMIIWIKHKSPEKKQSTFLLGMSFWLLLGIHDGLVSMGIPIFQYLMEYGFIGFAMIILWVVFKNYLEIGEDEKYRVITEFAHDCILVIQDHKIVLKNQAYQDFIGRFLSDPATNNFLNIIASEDQKIVLENYNTIMAGGHQTNPQTVRIRSEDIEQRFVEITSSPIQYRDKHAVLSIMRDITERKRADEEREQLQVQLNQAHKMEAIGTLAGGVAHQFNNALSVITMGVDLLKAELPDNELIDNYIELMKGSTDRMAQLTAQLLAYARGGKYQAKIISLNDFIENTLPVIQHNIDPAISMNKDLVYDILNVSADQFQMQMVLSAVMANASEALKGKGFIRITTRKEEIDEEFAKHHIGIKPGPYVYLTIEDNGKGMDEETRNRIFEPFFTTKFEGHGLGMAAVFGIIKNHDGWIFVDSDIGIGTVVRIYLPLIEKQLEEFKKPKVEPVKGTGTVLLIEDEEKVMKVSRALIERLGYKVFGAMTGKEAVKIAKNFHGEIDLAILDIVLPDMGGKAIYPLIMEACPNLKVIVCSGYSIDGPAQEILDAGAQGFIQKPYNAIELSEKLNTILKGRQ